MENTSPTSLAEKAADLRRAVLATQAPFWMPDPAYALILSLLARLFGRLEDMIRLWEDGRLPPPAPQRKRQRVPAPHTRTPSAPRRHASRPKTRPRHRTPEPRPLRIRIWWSRNRGARATFTLPNPRPGTIRDPPARHHA